MLIPAVRDLVGVVGASWDAEFALYQDDAQTQDFDLSVYDVAIELEIDGLAVLDSDSGLTITPASGLVVAGLTPAQTATVAPDTATRYRLKCVATVTGRPDRVDYPIRGLIRWQDK